ncbi:hypothetical protein MLD38_023404 [Melastoma candidum]|uniref:Uncharacterized protein n=1 Tax=Melastoma candidum TaxID=119954 RepID=A0ACB9QLJ7_9MYRT|nr:hypothetical protein MLD38_023404 [Melastoma candidum]
MPSLAFCLDPSIPPPPPPPPAPFFSPSPISPRTPSLDATMDVHSPWSPALSSSLYRVDGWGAPYFSVNSSGSVSVRPHGMSTLPHQEIDLLKIVKKVTDPESMGGLGLQLPLVVRLPDILRNRLESLQSAFDHAVEVYDYGSHYQGVFPVKCNQDRFVVEDVVKFGSSFRFGLEAGSKPELLLAMSCLCKGSPDALLVCNGFKDAEYISLALMARKLGLNCVIVLEQEEELDLVINLSRRLSIRPVIGVRAKLRTKHSGHFGSTSGEKGKFGLTTTQILRVVRELELAGMLDCFQLLHFHIGSQIPTTDLLADGVCEAAQIYCELVRLGAHMGIIDIGGGLGIDYDGTKSSDSEISVSYNLEEYAAAVVRAIRYVCDRKAVRHPVICSESGRAIVSHHSILLFEAVSSSVYDAPALSSLGLQYLVNSLCEDAHADYRNLASAAVRGEYETCLMFADRLKQRCIDQFKEGMLAIEHLAAVDGLCDLFSKAIRVSDPVRTYHVNLSIFTSIPDFWGIGQLFPIIPIHRLEQKPTARGILSDLTCDSDGKIDKFIGGESSLPLHELDGHNGNGYYLGMFLGGAYEEAIGGVHNLFGGPSVVSVSQCDGPHSFAVTRAMPGLSCGDVLRTMGHEPEMMMETLRQRAEEYVCGQNQGAVASRVGRSFSSMPYLTGTSSCGLINVMTSGMNVIGIGNGKGYYCCQVEEEEEEGYAAAAGAAAAGGGGEEEHWSYCCA